MKLKKQNLIVCGILSVALLLNACGNTNKNNNHEQQDSSKAKVEATNSEAQVTGTFTDSRDGKTYKTVKIGTQTWMAENLAYKVNNGCWAYDNKQSNVTTYGYLYNWETAKDVCPSGWHLPSDAEWTTLTDYLGGKDDAGGKLKETGTTHWESPNTAATNSSGFTALPCGFRYIDGTFSYVGRSGYWWSFTKDVNSPTWSRSMTYGNSYVGSYNYDKGSGLSVRCVKD